MAESARVTAPATFQVPRPRWYGPAAHRRYRELGLWSDEVLFDVVERNAEQEPMACVSPTAGVS